ncbi:MAG: hypothetical protein J6Y28_00485 [Acholeplasmatales bacterium]|nr:hypothetical protein [Acholeplasmatales bacterium]
MDNTLHFQEGYRYDDSYSKEEFFSACLKYLRDEYLCPPYIFEEAKFSEVNKIDIPIIDAHGSAIINYSRLLGYDKQVAYTTKKTTRYSDGTSRNQYSTSYKTETEWVRDLGTITGCADAKFIDPKFIDFISEQHVDSSSLIPLDNKELNSLRIDDVALDSLKHDILEITYRDNITYPVNKVKKEEYNGEVDIIKLSVTLVSMYAIDVTVRNKSFVLYACTNGSTKIYRLGDLPINDDQEEFNNKIYAISSKRDSITKLPRLFRLLSIILLSVLFVLLLALGINKNNLTIRLVSFIPLILEIIIVIILNKKIKKVTIEYGKQMGTLYEERDKLIKEERLEAYERYINNNNIKQKKVQ